ncbi:hypothetical protein FCV60_03490 [Vibrio sp. F13]|uniref:hypothetical protein n=2 Tax=unclassified Vibrio TaxID=2614977 RepID=UPI0010BDD477|nr:hypothetical protein [Vibrio sp. F13]TKF42929.1 hypothetical protein FCV49_15165 [Vibrio sp. F13]TKF56967.1 hypothetical protein FCV60_03490 [Vibrio sp. F13]TKG06270.1 hypothetical protein FCV67_15330 [Vibrio sp. F13]
MSNANTALNHLQNKKIEAARRGYLDASYYKQTVNHNSIMDIALNDEMVGNDLSEALERAIPLVDTTNFISEGLNAFGFYVNDNVVEALRFRNDNELGYRLHEHDEAVYDYSNALNDLIAKVGDSFVLDDESRVLVGRLISALELIIDVTENTNKRLRELKSTHLTAECWRELITAMLCECDDDFLECIESTWLKQMQLIEPA